jgi:asparagine synthase (glutamine-hydrolysing)
MTTGIADRTTLNLHKIQGLPGWVAHWSRSGDSSESSLRLMYSQDHALPAYASTSDLAVLIDGVVQNRREVLTDLREENLQTDADIVLHAYLRWGEDILQKVKGVFLLAILDRGKNKLLCIRDRCGIYPFFYADVTSGFYFSTSTEKLIRHPSVPNEINRSQIVDFLAHRRPLPE